MWKYININEYAQYCTCLGNFMNLFNKNLENDGECLVLRSLY